MTDTPSLVDFLKARLDDIDADAAHDRDCAIVRMHPEGWCDCDVPARVLADVAAKRLIVDQCASIVSAGTMDPFEDGAPDLAYEVLQLLALVYADHPDYQEKWKP